MATATELRERFNIPKKTEASQVLPLAVADIRRKREEIRAAKPDPEKEKRESLRQIPILGKLLFGTGDVTPSSRVAEDSTDFLIREGVVGFLTEGFRRKVNPTRAELGARIDKRIQKRIEQGVEPKRALDAAISDTIKSTPGIAKNVQDLRDPDIELTEEEKEAFFWINSLENIFAVIDAPIFFGTGKPFGKLLKSLVKAKTPEKAVEILQKAGVQEDVARRFADDAVKATDDAGAENIIRKASDESKKVFAEGRRVAEDISPELRPLAEEVRKFDTAEEFVEQGVTKFDELPERAKGALQAEARVKVTNEGVSPQQALDELRDKRFVKIDFSIDELKKTDPDIFADTFTKRGSVTKGRVIIDDNGKVIDGNNRVREAFERGDETIEAFLEAPKSQLTDFFNRVKGITAKVAEIPDELAPLAREARKFDTAEEFVESQELSQILRGTKGMTADDIQKTYPNIKLKKDVPAKDIHGNKVEIDKGEKLTPYELKGNKILLQDGETYLVSKNQFQNIKGQSTVAEGKPFAPELGGLEETVKVEKIPEEKIQSLLEDEIGQGMTRDEAIDFLKKEEEYIDVVGTKYEQYQLPGGKNYGEILIRAPEIDYTTEKQKLAKELFNKNIDDLTKIEKEQIFDKLPAQQPFKSPHWDEPNVISHLRLNEREYKNKDVTFMEELQSDWAKEAKEKGIADVGSVKSEIEEAKKIVAKKGEEIDINSNLGISKQIDDISDEYFGSNVDFTKAEQDRLEELSKIIYEKGERAGTVPYHPLVKGNKWQEPTIKRALQEAVENDADYFAWINGKQTSARYDLATKVDNINWTGSKNNRVIKIQPKEGSQKIEFQTKADGTIYTSGGGIPQDWTGKKLDEVLGKGLADEIMAKESGSLSGEGLKFGGEWAKNLYDRQVKNIVKDLTGAKVEKLDMGLPIEKSENTFTVFPKKITRTQGIERLTKNNLKVGSEITKNGETNYIITDVLGDGKFKAVSKNKIYDKAVELTVDMKEPSKKTMDKALQVLKKVDKTETFDISQKTTTQQGIKLTSEVKAKIRGEVPEIQTSGKKFEDTKSQLTDFFNRVKGGEPITPKVLPRVPRGEKPLQVDTSESLSESIARKATKRKGEVPLEIRTREMKKKRVLHKTLTEEGKVLKDSDGNVAFPRNIKKSVTPLKSPVLEQEAERRIGRIVDRQIESAKDALSRVQKKHGKTERIISELRRQGVSESEINGIILENGVKLVDTVKVKREANGVLSAVIAKKDIKEIKEGVKGVDLTKKWIPTRTAIEKVRSAGRGGKLAALEYYELPQIFSDRTGLRQWFYDPIREAQRNASKQKTAIWKRFEREGFWKESGWFTPDHFILSKTESEDIGRYFLFRQGRASKEQGKAFEQLTKREQRFVDIFDDVIAESEERFFKVARLNGKEPGRVDNYAPLMTNDDFKLSQNMGDVDFVFRKHPAFFSLKQRAEEVPFEMYELDYRKVAAAWIDKLAQFNNLGEVGVQVKYLANSDEFAESVGSDIARTTNKWLQDTFNPQVLSPGEKGLRFGRRFSAISTLGLNLASVVKQVLTQVPLTIIEKAPPKMHSDFAKHFDIDVKALPSITERRGNAAIMDMRSGFEKAFVGPLARFDKTNAQKSLNALLDKGWEKFIKEGREVTPETQAYIIKKAQDTLDMWYGGMTREQLPRAFRSEIGKIINMFIHPLTSQLNGFVYSTMRARGIKRAEKASEALVSALVIAYMEQVITNLSVDWSDEVEMTKDVLASLAGNIPILSQVVFAVRSDQPLQVSPAISNVSRLGQQSSKALRGQAEATDVGFALAEMFGTPKQFRRTFQGINLVIDGGVRDKSGKLLVPLKGTGEAIRGFLRGKYGTIATQDWIRNIGISREERKWYVPEVEFLQNGDYERKAELYRQFDRRTQLELRVELSDGQKKRLDDALKESTGNLRSRLRELRQQ